MHGKTRKSSAIFNVLSAVFLTPKLFSNMTVCRWVNVSEIWKAMLSFDKSAVTCPVTKCRGPEASNLRISPITLSQQN